LLLRRPDEPGRPHGRRVPREPHDGPHPRRPPDARRAAGPPGPDGAGRADHRAGLIGRRPGRAGGNAFYPRGKPLPPPSSRDSVTIVQHVQFQPLARRPTSGSRAGWWHLDCKTGVGTWDAHHIELEDDLVRIRLLTAGLALAAAVLLGAPTSFATPFPPG